MCSNTAIEKTGTGSLRLGWAVAAYIAFWPAAALWPGAASADTAKTPPDAIVKELMTRDLVGSAGKEVLMVTVEYLAGGASLPHRHNAQVFVYVLEGQVRMQVKGSAAVTLGPGETFYESPDDVHTISANASRTKPARILVFIVKDKGAPVSSEAGGERHP
jgi:quercetin dioxygenase-like cupin family protein